MSTTSDRLALLLKTKQWQRKELEKRYPSLDFDEIPFSAYRQLWMGRAYVRGLVGAWNAYGRSNTDADRDVLYDYSGHGRDIRLYNFAFEGMSGYGGYAIPLDKLKGRLVSMAFNETSAGRDITMTATSESANFYSSYIKTADLIADTPIRIKGNLGVRVVMTSEGNDTHLPLKSLITLSDGETGEFTISQTDIDSGYTLVYFGPNIAMSIGESITITFLPVYPGGLVSDGIDDYGQCVKGFALPDDYTIVAIRKPISNNGGAFASKGRTTGAFLFEAGSVNYSYGQSNNVGNNIPALFSYMSKNSYNGETIESGTEADTENDVFEVFRLNSSYYNQSVLYDERIYDHTLTKEEIQLVEDDMMFDYGEATGGGISDIHYVCDFDAKGRSNDEDEPMRSQWIDKAAGKVIDLNNYAYAGMSGWGGYGQDFSAWAIVQGAPYQSDLITVNADTIHIKGTFSEGYNRAGIRLSHVQADIVERFFMQVSGLKEGQKIYVRDETPSPGISYTVNTDGVEDIRFTTGTGGRGNLFIFVEITTGAEAVDITIEQLPLYPGALVSDGVDDYGVTQEVINDNIGYALLHYNRLIENPSNWGYYMDGLYSRRLYISYKIGGDMYTNLTGTIDDGKILTGKCNYTEPASEKLNVASNNESRERGQVAIYRLILIREQLDGAQTEFLKWKVEKEYRDWRKANGYEYALQEKSKVSVDPDKLDFGSEGGSQQIQITSNDSWTIS